LNFLIHCGQFSVFAPAEENLPLLLLETVSIAFLQEEGKEPALGVFFLSAGSTNAINAFRKENGVKENGKKTESDEFTDSNARSHLTTHLISQ
jgi:hypothetical protein